MEKTAEDIANDIQFLPVSLEPSVKAGIDQAQAKAIEAAKSGLQDSGKYYKSPIPEGTFPAVSQKLSPAGSHDLKTDFPCRNK